MGFPVSQIVTNWAEDNTSLNHILEPQRTETKTIPTFRYRFATEFKEVGHWVWCKALSRNAQLRELTECMINYS